MLDTVKNPGKRISDLFIQALASHVGQSDYKDDTLAIGARVTIYATFTDAAHIGMIKTPPELRGIGLASFALDETTAMADRHGIILSIDSDNSQIRAMCERRGFVTSGTYGMTRQPADMRLEVA